MENPARIADGGLAQQSDFCDRSYDGATFDDGSLAGRSRFPPLWATAASLTSMPHLESHLALQTSDESSLDLNDPTEISSMTLAEFVRRKFIPEFVDIKRSAGRAHFRDILKCILLSEKAAYSFVASSDRPNVKRKAIESWPYMDSLRLCDINEDTVQHITSTALESGYSIQTATHIRNVIRAIYSHAIEACCYTGRNPAALVTLPAVLRKNAHTLTLAQLKQVMAAMRFPERAIAHFALLTDLNLVEICGLQWQYVNLSSNRRLVEEEWIPAKTIAVRNQWYRGEFRPVTGSRKRLVPVPELLCSMLRDLSLHKQFARPQDFVLTSRSGTPVYPGNIAKRRLKSIGQSCEMPWLSWRVLHRTHTRLRSEFGRHLHREYEKVLPLHMW
jgi:site-specific recombinase XerC